ncbi:Lrp/AsnC family transcriptional regulator [Arthrobacter sp. 135MFCol5.1]|uniref:Lrp/AsnC family transcriptional regulator n=1 Tax=Arthrobacter sp. 135MFCol5.1 TaxID=1158050 RepID=UPI00036E20DA|nr:Lrp/AsnC family transcriptional regulator [Arthrobacter sp. 135MFCol5.1]
MNDAQFDEVDEKMLWELSRDARISNSALADRVGVSQATVHNRLRRLRDLGVWQSNHAEIDPSKLGFHVQALVSVRLKPSSRARLHEYMERTAAFANTVSVYALGGQTDCLVHMYCVSTNQLRDLVTNQFNLDPDVAYADTQIVYEFRRGAQHMQNLQGWDDLRP